MRERCYNGGESKGRADEEEKRPAIAKSRAQKKGLLSGCGWVGGFRLSATTCMRHTRNIYKRRPFTMFTGCRGRRVGGGVRVCVHRERITGKKNGRREKVNMYSGANFEITAETARGRRLRTMTCIYIYSYNLYLRLSRRRRRGFSS